MEGAVQAPRDGNRAFRLRSTARWAAQRRPISWRTMSFFGQTSLSPQLFTCCLNNPAKGSSFGTYQLGVPRAA